jgi:tetratricopeptide (TPR) repeat protein
VALGNLGNLYAYYIKDNAQAENYYKQAIAKGSTQAYLYVQLGEVYRDVFKDAAKAKATADQGLAKIPNDPSLLQFKATLN